MGLRPAMYIKVKQAKPKPVSSGSVEVFQKENGTSPQFEAGMNLVEAGDYIAALKVFAALANAGSLEAQHQLGMMFVKGNEKIKADLKRGIGYLMIFLSLFIICLLLSS